MDFSGAFDVAVCGEGIEATENFCVIKSELLARGVKPYLLGF